MRFRTNDVPVIAVVGIFGLMLVAVGGWVANIVKLYGLAQAVDPNYVMAVLRAVGIFMVPLGAVLGFL